MVVTSYGTLTSSQFHVSKCLLKCMRNVLVCKKLFLKQIARLLHSLVTCFPIVPAFNVGHFVVWDINFCIRQTVPVGLLIRVPPLSYALMGGAISPLVSAVHSGGSRILKKGVRIIRRKERPKNIYIFA